MGSGGNSEGAGHDGREKSDGGQADDGGRGLRERAERAVVAAGLLLPAKWFGDSASEPGQAPDPAAEKRAFDELVAVDAELTTVVPPDDPLQTLVRARLGELYAMRHLRRRTAEAGDGDSDRDRDRALELLRAARAGDLPAAERRGAAALLAAALLGRLGGRLEPPQGRLAELNGAVEIMRRLAVGDAHMSADLAETRALIREISEDLSDEKIADLEAGLAGLDRLTAAVRTGNVSELLDAARSVPGQDPTGPTQGIFDLLSGMRDRGDIPESLPMLASALAPEPKAAQSTEEPLLHPLIDAASVMHVEASSPGTVLPEELAALVRLVDADAESGRYEGGWGKMASALARVIYGMRSGDAEVLGSVAALLQHTLAQDADDGSAWLARVAVPNLLQAVHMSGGNLGDRETAGQLLDRLLTPGSGSLDSRHAHLPDGQDLLLYSRWLGLALRMENAFDDTDTERLRELIGELDELRETSSPRLTAFYGIPLLLFISHAALAYREEDRSALAKARTYLEEALAQPALPFSARTMVENGWLLLLALANVLQTDPDPAGLMEVIDRVRAGLGRTALHPDYEVRTRRALSSTLEILYEQTNDPAMLNAAIQDLELGRAAFNDNITRDAMQGVLWDLATIRRARGDRASDDHAVAVAAARESLDLLAEDVLLQLGSDHGLQIARQGTARGLLAASWAASDGDLDGTVELLETGRTLVLRAAAASSGVAEQLEAAGEHGLAAQWRSALGRQRGTGTDPAGFGLPFGPEAGFPDLFPGGFTVPSALRRRALAVLRRVPNGETQASAERADTADGTEPPLRRLLGPCGVDDLVAAVRGSGADALVYLVPGQASEDGLVLLLPRTGMPRAWRPAGLTRAGRAPLDRYLDAAAVRSAVDGAATEDAEAAWQTALDALCDWAGQGVMGSVVAAASEAAADPGTATGTDISEPSTSAATGTADRPVRLVLVPCGNLGAVPWHAARLPAADTDEAREADGDAPEPGGTTARPCTYACEHAVITYAASGGEFVRAAARERGPCGARAVLVADPMEDLTFAEDEVDAVRRYYPDALVYGGLDEPARTAGAGTPEEILAHLPGGSGSAASLLHLAVHGRADQWAVSSAVDLAPSPGDAPEGPGRLTVTRILDVPAPVGPGPGATGGLVVLSACETDLSTRDHDEALTPATAFLARGASDVVGTRWQVADLGAAPMMVVFHHYVAVAGLAPPDALRAAQLWMLDPERSPVPGLCGNLLALAERYRDLFGTVPAWAGFIHQGNPRSAVRNPHPPARGSTS